MRYFLRSFAAVALLALLSYNKGFAGDRSPFISGVKGGIHMYKMEGSNWNEQFRVNLHGGFFLGLRSRTVGVQMEMNYNQSTFKTGNNFHQLYQSYYNDAKDSLKAGSFVLNQITVPLLFQVRPIPGIWIQAGPEYSMVLGVKDKDKLLKDAEAMFNRGAVNGVVGLWLQHGRHFNSGARFVFAMTDLNNSTVADTWGAKSIQLHLGLNF